MSLEKLETRFDYDGLDSVSRTYVKQQTREIRSRLGRVIHDIWDIGKRLSEVRSRLQHGQFIAWLKVEFGWSQRTAYNFINVFQSFPNLPKNASLEIATTALYLLAAPSTPQRIRNAFLGKAKSGKKVTYTEVKNALKKQKISTSETIASTNSAKTLKPHSAKKTDIISVHPKHDIAKPNIKGSQPTAVEELTTAWQVILGRHHIFVGDTASSQFYQNVPSAAFILAVTSDDWDHDWVINHSKTIMVLQEADFDSILLTELVSRFSAEQDIVVFPWIPHSCMLRIAHELGRQVYAGDPSLENCQKAIAEVELSRSGLKNSAI